MAEGRPGYYALYLDLHHKACLVVGGGPMAADKARGLAAVGADVTVVAPAFEEELLQMGGRHEVRLLAHAFVEDDLEGMEMVIDASGDDPQGVRVSAAARRRRVLVNVLDRTPLCDFIAPAMVRRGPLQVAISTAGRSPFMASHLRRLLEATLGPEYGQLVELAGELRDRLRGTGLPLAEQAVIYERIPGCGALEMLRAGNLDGARRAVQACALDPVEVQMALL
ncbi:MAG: precorrin-2 dehydrogenase/sirohydrochlorin ferrochelatase family protein [Candidatus Dormibacteria bacterium]